MVLYMVFDDDCCLGPSSCSTGDIFSKRKCLLETCVPRVTHHRNLNSDKWGAFPAKMGVNREVTLFDYVFSFCRFSLLSLV